MFSIEALDRLQEWFAKLPGVGPKSAARMAYHIIEMNPEEVKQFAQDLYKSRLSVRYCPLCGNLTENEGPCSICSDETRDQSTVCVVKDPRDVMALERIR